MALPACHILVDFICLNILLDNFLATLIIAFCGGFPLPSVIRAEFGVVDDRLPRRLHHQRAKRLVAAESLRPLRLPLPGIVGCRDEPEERGERPLVWETRHVASDFPYQVHRRQRDHYRRRHQRHHYRKHLRISESGNRFHPY